MEEHIKIFAERLKTLRDERGMTLIQVSEKSGVGVSTLSQYENCEREVKIFNL
jgi:transcriptional regulator with XRE-family HTH domain